MEYEMQPYIVCVKTDDENRITAINSSAFLADASGWVQIDSGFGDRYHHAQGNYLPKPLTDMRGVYRYRLVDGKPVERTEGEMDADFDARPVYSVKANETDEALAEIAALAAENAERIDEQADVLCKLEALIGEM